MLLGISSFTYGWSIGIRSHMPERPLSATDLVQRAVDFGVGCLQIGDNLPLDRLPDSERRELKALLDKYGLRLEVGARGLTERRLKDYIEIATYFGAPLLRFVVDYDGYEPTPAEIIETIRGARFNLHDAGLTLGIENHDRFKAVELSTVVRSIDDATVGICLDTVNSLGAGEDVARVLQELAPFTVNLHIKDFRIVRAVHNMGFTVTGAPAGQGMLDVPALVERLAGYGRCQSAVLEQWVPLESALSDTLSKEERWAMESMEYLKQLPAFRTKQKAAG